MPVVFNNADIQKFDSDFDIYHSNYEYINFIFFFFSSSWATHIKKNYDMLRLQYVKEQKRIKK